MYVACMSDSSLLSVLQDRLVQFLYCLLLLQMLSLLLYLRAGVHCCNMSPLPLLSALLSHVPFFLYIAARLPPCCLPTTTGQSTIKDTRTDMSTAYLGPWLTLIESNGKLVCYGLLRSHNTVR